MFSNSVNSCSCCGLHGCQRVTIIRKAGGDMRAVVSLASDSVSVGFKNLSKGGSVSTELKRGANVSFGKVGNGIKPSFSLVCRTSQGAWEYLMVKEGEILLIDGQKVLVKRSKD